MPPKLIDDELASEFGGWGLREDTLFRCRDLACGSRAWGNLRASVLDGSWPVCHEHRMWVPQHRSDEGEVLLSIVAQLREEIDLERRIARAVSGDAYPVFIELLRASGGLEETKNRLYSRADRERAKKQAIEAVEKLGRAVANTAPKEKVVR